MLFAYEKIDYYKGLIRREIIDILVNIKESKIKQAIEYMLLSGGKRVRPLLTIGSAEILTGECFKAVKIGVYIECMHTYSLIHDDLPAMDDDNQRRGMPTCHVKFDEATAILAGDALLNLVFEVISADDSLADKQKVDIIKIISSASGANGMLLGQIMDIEFQDIKHTPKDIIKIHQLKTGALFIACMKIAGILMETSLENINLLGQFGNDFGSLFQIADDLEDIDNAYEINIIRALNFEQSIKIAKEKYNTAIHILNKFNADDNSILRYLLNNLYQKIEKSLVKQ